MNRFSRLKHYKPDLIDPKENHASECLAACIKWSAGIRGEVISMLFEAGAKVFSNEYEKVETRATWPTCFPDIVMHFANAVVVLEVKVGSPELSEQLEGYGDAWKCIQESGKELYIFSLVRSGNLSSEDLKAIGCYRITWSEIARRLSIIATQTSDPTTANLAKDLISYLEAEEIFLTMKPSTLNNYKAGLDARRALDTVFNHVESRIKDFWGKDYTVHRRDRLNEWPAITVDHPKWSLRVGNGVERPDNGRWFEVLVLSFCVPGVWESNEHGFEVGISLWNRWWGNVEWNPELRKELAKIDGTLVFGPEAFNERVDGRVVAWRAGEPIGEKEIATMDSDALINRIFYYLDAYRNDLDIMAGLVSSRENDDGGGNPCLSMIGSGY